MSMDQNFIDLYSNPNKHSLRHIMISKNFQIKNEFYISKETLYH